MTIKSFEKHKKRIEQEYSHLNDEDIIEDLARIDIINGESEVNISDFQNRDEVIKLSGEIGKIRNDYQKINTMFDLVLGDISDILKYKNHIEKNTKTSNDNTLNRLVIHLLSSGRLFIDTIESHMKSKYGKKSTEYSNFKDALSIKYNQKFVYRFFYYLRNFTQHVGFPVTTISSELVMDPETNQENTKVMAYLNIDYLLRSNYDWKKIVKDDLRNFQKEQKDLEMFDLIKAYYQIMAEVMYESKKQFLDLNHQYLLSLIKEWELLGLKSNKYAISKISKYDLIYNPTNITLSPIDSRYDIEMIYIDLSEIGLVNITN